MRPQVITTTGVSISDPVVLNHRQSDFKVGISAVVTGIATYTIEHSYDDPADFTSAALYNSGATWHSHNTAALVAATTTQDGSYTIPIRAARINQTLGAGSVTATFIQGNAT